MFFTVFGHEESIVDARMRVDFARQYEPAFITFWATRGQLRDYQPKSSTRGVTKSGSQNCCPIG